MAGHRQKQRCKTPSFPRRPLARTQAGGTVHCSARCRKYQHSARHVGLAGPAVGVASWACRHEAISPSNGTRATSNPPCSRRSRRRTQVGALWLLPSPQLRYPCLDRARFSPCVSAFVRLTTYVYCPPTCSRHTTLGRHAYTSTTPRHTESQGGFLAALPLVSALLVVPAQRGATPKASLGDVSNAQCCVLSCALAGLCTPCPQARTSCKSAIPCAAFSAVRSHRLIARRRRQQQQQGKGKGTPGQGTPGQGPGNREHQLSHLRQF